MFSNVLEGGQSQGEHETTILLFYLRYSFRKVTLKDRLAIETLFML